MVRKLGIKKNPKLELPIVSERKFSCTIASEKKTSNFDKNSFLTLDPCLK
jgi:hypothetical protein